MTITRILATAAAVATLALTGCSGPPEDDPLAGCLTQNSGTIAIGVVNSSGDNLVVEAIELSAGSGVDIIDRFLVIDENAGTATVEFSTEGRSGYSAGDLDSAAIMPGEAAYIGVEVALTASAPGNVDGLVVTSGGRAQTVPVRLELGGDCG